MPTYRSVTISLISQFDLLTIPEFAPPPTSNGPFAVSPSLISPELSLVSVYIPTYPSSQFWITYSIAPPHPPNALYYFKLFLNGSCIVSWGCGAQDGYKGKTMFALYNDDQAMSQGSALGKWAFYFKKEKPIMETSRWTGLGSLMEVRVYRSKGRMREFPCLGQHVKEPVLLGHGNGIGLVSAGTLSEHEPRRYYRFSLFDPLDQPFATFRYYCYRWEQLQSLGVLSSSIAESSSNASPSKEISDLFHSVTSSPYVLPPSFTPSPTLSLTNKPQTPAFIDTSTPSFTNKLLPLKLPTTSTTISYHSPSPTAHQLHTNANLPNSEHLRSTKRALTENRSLKVLRETIASSMKRKAVARGAQSRSAIEDREQTTALPASMVDHESCKDCSNSTGHMNEDEEMER